jgi:hypothetical protein
MKDKLKKKINLILYFGMIIVLLALFAGFYYKNYQYNNTRWSASLNRDTLNADTGTYELEDINVKIYARGGDTGAWTKGTVFNSDGTIACNSAVGTIYEADIVNTSEGTVSDWSLKVPINEKMWLANSWNSKIEIHQDVNGEEKIMSIDLSDYSDYDITLDYTMDSTGPMIPLNPGDYFVYNADAVEDEIPIKSADSSGEYRSVRFGFIVYIPDQAVDYVTSFSGAELQYTIYKNPTKQPWFKILASLIAIWFLSFIIAIVVKIKIRRILRQQKAQKEHDEEMVQQTMQLIINLIESKDSSTKGHSIRVAMYSKMIAGEMGFSEDVQKNIYYVGLMHDCGKMYIPDEILKNPGRLSDEEYAIMKKHTTYGAEVLKDFTTISGIDVGAKYHHERYDGKGYPSGLKGEEIPIIARIIGVADAFDAMSSNRCYRKRLTTEVIMNELKNNRGKQFDPEALDAMLSLIRKGDVVIPA